MNNTTTIASILHEKTKPTPLPTNYREWFYHLPYDKPFVMSMSGEASTGKSSFALKLMSILCSPTAINREGDKCLYLNIEEPIRRGATIQDKCRQMQLSKRALKNVDIISDSSKGSLSHFKKLLDMDNYKYCVIDSVSMLAGNSSNKHIEIWDWIQSRNENFICILHYTKTKLGKMQGPVLWEHNPDIVVWLNNKGFRNTQAEFKKNRYFPGDVQKNKFNTYTSQVIKG
jgi:predicted ATP-dependent serine protease